MHSFFIKDCLSAEEIIECLSAFFGELSVPASIAVFDYEHGIQNEDVLVEINSMRGDFCINLCVYTKIQYTYKELVIAFCRHSKTEILISDDSLNPYSWILINENGEEKSVYQRTDIDEEDLFLLKR